MTASLPSKNRVGHVGHLGPRRSAGLDHGLQHFGGRDHVLARFHRRFDQCLLGQGQLGKGQFHPQIAPGHHNAIAFLQDLSHVLDRGQTLDLGDQMLAIHQGPDLTHLPGMAHKN